MPLQFWWKPKDTPVEAKDNRKEIALELGGDDKSLADGTAGRIELSEVGGSGRDKGEAESDQPRLLAVFHGKFHRDPKAKPEVRITFEILLGKGTTVFPTDGEVQGYDPECIRGIDAFVFTFLNRQFQVNFPFFLDTRSEGTFVEIQAVAIQGEEKDGTELGKSAVLHLRIRREHEVETTTKDPAGGGEKYTTKLVGNLIVHHEDYVVDAASRAASASWPSSVSLKPTPIPVKAGGIPFQAFTAGELKVILMNDLIEGLFSGDPKADAATKATAKRKIADNLSTIFTDAGFQGSFVWEDEAAGRALAASFRSAFRGSDSQWTLKDDTQPMSIPFWTFIVAHDTSIDPNVGVAAGYKPDFSRTQVTAGSKVFLLPYPSPIGSGNKAMQAPTRIRTDYFSPVGREVDSKAAKVAIVIAHEIGHSIGLMHEAEVLNKGPYDEGSASPVMSIMSSSVENDSFGVNMRFSNQAKVIWQQAFQVQPNWDNSYLRNKTWGDDWATVDWGERMHRFFQLHHEDGMTSPLLAASPSRGDTVPFTGSGKASQRGTYVP